MPKIEISTKKKVCPISQDLYGLFFEDINRAGDGGLYAELLRNRAFDDGVIPKDCTYDAKSKTIVSATGWRSSFDCCEEEGIAAWDAMDGASISLISDDTLNENRKRALMVRFCGGYITNDGFMGVPVEQGKVYRFYMFAKSEREVSVWIKLCSKEGVCYAKQELTTEGDYTKYECILTADTTEYDARLVISSDSDACIKLGFTSLFPVDTYMGRENGLRTSLVERMLGLHPKFLRFPGGCIVEGFTKETAFRFKDTIGPVWERKPHWLLWAYMTTNGLGYHEYLQFCEDANIHAMYVFNCGMSCQGRCPDYFDDELVQEFYEDTVQAILYATEPADGEWGRKRAANGHPEPFTVLKYIEIGNENWGEEYFKRYAYFYEKLKEQFPDFIYIATDHTEKQGLRTEYVDEHFYSDPIFFAVNENLYDKIDRGGVDIYCGEYASTIGCKEGTLYGALGEAAFLTGVERNQDKVHMTSYAPLFKNVNYVSWEPDMIVFDNHRDYVIPSYYMLRMYAANRGDYVCEYKVHTDYDRRLENGAFRFRDEGVHKEIKYNGELFDKDTVLIGDTKAGKSTLSALVEDTGKIHISFWDRGTESDDQNHYDWMIENGKSKVVHYNGWSAEPICEETECIMEKKNEIMVETREDAFTLTLNGTVIHQHVLAGIPRITAVVTVDEETETVITKIVNFTEQEECVEFDFDCKMDAEVLVTTLTGEAYSAGNSFENPHAVVPVNSQTVLDNKTIKIAPRSINILRQKCIG